MQSLVILKPDGVKCGLLLPFLQVFGQPSAMRLFSPPSRFLSWHYKEHQCKPFYPGLMEFMLSGPLCVAIVPGDVAAIREKAMQFRIDFGPCINPANLVHASDSPESAKHEIGVWSYLL